MLEEEAYDAVLAAQLVRVVTVALANPVVVPSTFIDDDDLLRFSHVKIESLRYRNKNVV